MTTRLRWTVGAAAALAVIITPAAAQAATKTVSLGVPGAKQRAFEPTGSDVNAFFPSNVAVRVGDRVSFESAGFHTVHFPKTGGKSTPFQIPTGKKVAGINDAAGLPFWFNGQEGSTTNPAFFMKSGFGKTLTHSGSSKEILSGFPPFQGRPKPMRVRFTKPGLFKYFCDLHPGMAGSVRVVPRNKPVPSARLDKLRVAKQVASALAVAKKLSTTPTPANTVSVGADGKGGVTYLGMVPAKLTVPRGTTVTFAMAKDSTEVHTATLGPGTDKFGPGPGPPKTSYLGAISAGFQSAKGDARADYSSEAPPTPPALYSPALHGNGFWNSGVMDAVAQSPLPPSGKLTFGTPGTYEFVCLIHTNMKGTITVQ